MKSAIFIKGNIEDGYILTIQDEDSEQDIAIMYNEIPTIIKKLNAIKKTTKKTRKNKKS